MKTFEEELSYSIVEYEKKELIFSVAFGCAEYKIGMKNKDVLHVAGEAMYKHKKALKEKYHMVGR